MFGWIKMKLYKELIELGVLSDKNNLSDKQFSLQGKIKALEEQAFKEKERVNMIFSEITSELDNIKKRVK